MLIYVTAEDIMEGVQASCTDCPVLRAIKRQTGKQCRMDNVCIENPEGGHMTPPAEVRRFVLRFDALQVNYYPAARLLYIMPFSFELPDAFLS